MEDIATVRYLNLLSLGVTKEYRKKPPLHLFIKETY